VAGTWAGTVSFTAGGVAGQELFQMKLTQAAGTTAVAGSYTARRFSGNISGEIADAAFNGTFEFNSNAQGQICVGTFTVSGPARGNTLTWTSPNVVGSSCTNTPVDLVIQVQRQ